MQTQQMAGLIPTLTGQVPTSLVSAMTFPVWGLVIFILWTIVVVVLLLTVRIRHLAAGGSIKDSIQSFGF